MRGRRENRLRNLQARRGGRRDGRKRSWNRGHNGLQLSIASHSRIALELGHSAGRTGVNYVPELSGSATQLLLRWKGGDQDALQALIPLVYKELRLAARRALRLERSDHTLQSTELVHEVYLRLAGGQPLPTENRLHFVALSARLMRQILVDYARRRAAAKRGPQYKISLDESFDLPQKEGIDVTALDQALSRLARRDVQQERIVEMRFFGGLTVEETALALEISPATVKRDWTMAKAWLTREMGRDAVGRDEAVAAN